MFKVDRYVPRKRNKTELSFYKSIISAIVLVTFLQIVIRLLLFFPINFAQAGFEPRINRDSLAFFLRPWLDNPITGDIVFIQLPNSSYEGFCKIMGPKAIEGTFNCKSGKDGFNSDVDGPLSDDQIKGVLWFNF